MGKELTVSSNDIDVHLNKERVTNMLTIADQFHKAGCFGKDVQNTFQAFAKIQAGAEMGMPPMEAMSSLYIVNGNITIWGKGLTLRLRKFGWKISYQEKQDEATATIKKGDEEYSYTATTQEVKSLGSKAASFALKDKLKWHAISRICRFYVPEVLGAVSYVTEEIDDLPNFKGSAKVVETDTNLDALPEAEPVDFFKRTMDSIKDAKTKEELEAAVMATEGLKFPEEETAKVNRAIEDKQAELVPSTEKAPEEPKKEQTPVEMAEEVFGTEAKKEEKPQQTSMSSSFYQDK